MDTWHFMRKNATSAAQLPVPLQLSVSVRGQHGAAHRSHGGLLRMCSTCCVLCVWAAGIGHHGAKGLGSGAILTAG